MKPTRPITLTVTFDWPIDASAEEVKTYIHDAVLSHCGSLHPDDPMFDLNRDSVKVALTRKQTRTK